MAKIAVREAKTDVARNWQQRTTRAAILEAARRLAAREGAAQLTLARVADEANFSPNTVYAYFVNKTELMLAIVADDLAALARQMHDVFPANEDVGTEDESPTESPEDAQSEEQQNFEPAEAATEIGDANEVTEPSLPPGVVSDALPLPEAGPAPAPIGEAVQEVSQDAELPAEQDFVSEHAEIESPEAVAETAVEVELHEPASADEPAVHGATEEPAQLYSTAEVELEAPPTLNPEPDADDKVAQATSEPAGDAEPTLLAELQPSSMPPAEKEWALEPGRNDETTGALTRLQESIAKLEARPVDAWLERRLRELERMITALEERQGNAERSSGAAGGLVEQTVRDIQTRLEAVENGQKANFDDNAKVFGLRVDASEKRLREMLGDLRTLTMVSSSRLDVLESEAGKRAPFQNFDAPPASESPAEMEGTPQPDVTAEKADAPVETATAEATEPSYLSQARRSAMAAAALAVPQPSDSRQRFASTMSSIKAASSRSRYFIAGGIALLVVLLGAGMALKRHAADSDVTAQSPLQIGAASHGAHAKLLPSQTMAPQIRLVSLANRGNADAQLLLGLEYLDGTGAVKNESEAAQWISQAAARGDAVAQFWLGTLYANGRGVKTDPSVAMHWYEEAAMQGNRKAMHQLAVSYAEGWGATRNYAEAARWFSRAASLGYVDSAFNLGVLYERGLGMPQSLLDAYKWYSIAAAMGDKGSPPRIAVLKTQMNPDDIAGATQAANSFAPDAIDQVANATPQVAQLPKN